MTQDNNSFLSKLRRFLVSPRQIDLMRHLDDVELGPQYNLGFGANNLGNNSLMRDVPAMLQDPIIQSCLNLIMETTFQTNYEHEVFWIESKIPEVKSELDNFHFDSGFQNLVLTLAYNILLWGNLPIEHKFDSEGRMIGITLIPDFTSIIPIIISNTLVGFQVGGEFRYPYEYTYAQLSYYKNLGGTSRQFGSLYQTQAEDGFANEFVYAPSYLTSAAKPWRYLNLIEDALLLNRLDQSNYYRIISVDVGANPYSKSSIQLLNYYRNLFKKVRRVSYDSAGMASRGTGQNFEVVVPKMGTNGLSVENVGGNVEVSALADVDLLTNRLFGALRVQPSMIGYSQDAPSSMGDSPAVLWDQRFARLCKTLAFSVFEALRSIDLVYLRSKGYDVNYRDWVYRTVGISVMEDKERSELLKDSVETFGTLSEKLKNAEVEFDANALARSILSGPLSGAGVSIDEILGKKTDDSTVTASHRSLFKQSPFTSKQVQVLVGSGFISSKEAAVYLDDSSKNMLIASSRKFGSCLFQQLRSETCLVPDDTLVDCSQNVFTVEGLVTDDILSSIENIPYNEFESLELPEVVSVPSDLVLNFRAGEISQVPSRVLDSAVMIRDRLILTSREDVLSYLQSSLYETPSILINRFWKV